MRDWAMFSFEGNNKVDKIFKEVCALKNQKSSYEIWTETYKKLMDLASDYDFAEAIDSDVTMRIYNELSVKGVIKLTMDDYYNGMEEISENSRRTNMEY